MEEDGVNRHCCWPVWWLGTDQASDGTISKRAKWSGCHLHWSRPYHLAMVVQGGCLFLIVIICHVILGLHQCYLSLLQGVFHSIFELVDGLDVRLRLSRFNPIHGVCPMLKRNGVCWVEEWTWLLYWNSAKESNSTQSSWHSLVKTQIYCSSSWLTSSICPSPWGW